MRGQLANGERVPIEALDIQLWQAFGSREQMLRAPASKVRRVTTYLIAKNEYDHELREEREKQDEVERDARSNAT